MTLKELREKRAEVINQQRKIFDKAEADNRNMNRSENQQFKNLQKDLDKYNEEIADKELQVQRIGAGVFSQQGRQSNILGSIAAGLVTGNRAISDELLQRDISFVNGSAVVQDPVVLNEVVHSLQANNRLVDLGTRLENIVNFSQWPIVTAAPSVTWFADGDTVSPDNALTISSKKIDLKTAVVLVKVSKLWLLDSGDRGRMLVATEIENAIKAEIIRVVLSGNSSNNEPTGLDNITGIQTIDAGGNALTNYSQYIAAAGKLLAVDVPADRIGYIQGVKSWEQRQSFAATDGQPLMAPRGIADMRNFQTSAVLENYGTGTDETRMYFGDFSNLVVGFGGTFRMELVERYSDTMHTAFMVYMRMDVQALRANNFVRVENIAIT